VADSATNTRANGLADRTASGFRWHDQRQSAAKCADEASRGERTEDGSDRIGARVAASRSSRFSIHPIHRHRRALGRVGRAAQSRERTSNDTPEERLVLSDE